MNCKNLKQKLNRTLFCKKKNKIIKISECNNCKYKEYKVKVSNNNLLKKQSIKGKKHKLTKATEIPKKIKLIVWERDEHKCIFCHTPVTWHYANSHFIKRSHSGLGIDPRNIMTNCYKCHKLYEESPKREEMKEIARNHFKSKYDNWNEKDLIYIKWL